MCLPRPCGCRALRGAYLETLAAACQRLEVSPPPRGDQVPQAEIYRVEAALRQRGLDVMRAAAHSSQLRRGDPRSAATGTIAHRLEAVSPSWLRYREVCPLAGSPVDTPLIAYFGGDAAARSSAQLRASMA